MRSAMIGHDEEQRLVRAFFDDNETWLAKVLTEGVKSKECAIRGPAQSNARLLLSAFEGAMLVARPYSDPERFVKGPKKFWELTDEIVQNTMDSNYVVADQLGRRVTPILMARGWGRIVNVTTKLDTMNRAGSAPYGPSKAALEMATEIWAKELAGTGVTVNIVNPGAGANTPGMAEEMREWSATGKASKLVEPEEMVAPLLFVVSRDADKVHGYRFDANSWMSNIPPAVSASRTGRKVGFELYPLSDCLSA